MYASRILCILNTDSLFHEQFGNGFQCLFDFFECYSTNIHPLSRQFIYFNSEHCFSTEGNFDPQGHLAVSEDTSVCHN